MTTNLQRASVVSRHVQILSVALESARLDTQLDPFSPAEELDLAHRFRATPRLEEGHPDHLEVRVEFQLEASDKGVDGTPQTLLLEAAFRLLYSLEGAATFPEDAVRHFAELNGTYNAWPYWRELVHTITGRAGLAPFVVPVFRPTVKDLEEEESRAPV